MITFSNEVHEAAQKLGQFYLLKNHNDYNKAEEEIRSLGIIKLEVIDNTICVHLSRVGMFIGAKGLNLQKLEKFLGNPIKIYEENNIVDLIVPVNYDDDYLEFESLIENILFTQNEDHYYDYEEFPH